MKRPLLYNAQGFSAKQTSGEIYISIMGALQPPTGQADADLKIVQFEARPHRPTNAHLAHLMDVDS